MKRKVVCPYCNTVFFTGLNAKKYCKRKCAELASRQSRNKELLCLCQWCATVFKAKRKRKFCDNLCRKNFAAQKGVYLKKQIPVRVRISVNDVAKECKKTGITYGKYVLMKKL